MVLESHRSEERLLLAGEEKNPVNKVHCDPFLSPDVISKRYTRLCTASPEHTPYADGIDLNELRVSDNPLTMSLRSSKRKRVENESAHPAKAQETPTLSGVLRSLDAYCTWAFGEKGKNIFQHLLDGGENSALMVVKIRACCYRLDPPPPPQG